MKASNVGKLFSFVSGRFKVACRYISVSMTGYRLDHQDSLTGRGRNFTLLLNSQPPPSTGLLLLWWGETVSPWNWASNGQFAHPLDDTWVSRAAVKLDWHIKTEGLGGKHVQVLLCPPQIPHELTWTRTRASGVRSRRWTARTLGWPSPLGAAVRLTVVKKAWSCTFTPSIRLHGVVLK
jgi:hypothetical protein